MMMVYYISARQLVQIFTQSIDSIDVTTVTLSPLNSINAIDVTGCWGYLWDILGIFWEYFGDILEIFWRYFGKAMYRLPSALLPPTNLTLLPPLI